MRTIIVPALGEAEMGKPYNGVVYDLMKRSRHVYHYSVPRVKKNKINIQKQRLADSFSDKTKIFGKMFLI